MRLARFARGIHALDGTQFFRKAMSRPAARQPAFSSLDDEAVLAFVRRNWKPNGNLPPGLTFGLWNGGPDDSSVGFSFAYGRPPDLANLPSSVHVSLSHAPAVDPYWWSKYFSVLIDAFHPQWILATPDWVYRANLSKVPGWLTWVSEDADVTLRSCGRVIDLDGGELLVAMPRLLDAIDEAGVAEYLRLCDCVTPRVRKLHAIEGFMKSGAT